MVKQTIFSNPKAKPQGVMQQAKSQFSSEQAELEKIKELSREELQANRTHMEAEGDIQLEKQTYEEVKSNTTRLHKLVNNSKNVLFSFSPIFPFDFFPDRITIDVNKINISMRNFFFSERVMSMPIEHILDIFVETSPFSATLKIVDQGYRENYIVIKFLKKSDAFKARRILQGLLVASKEGVDLTKVASNNLVQRLEELGAAQYQKSV